MARMVVQLSAVGAVLTFLFSVASLPWTLAMALVMVLFASREIVARQKRRLSGWWGYGLGTATMTLAAATLTSVALLGSLQTDPWYAPRYAIPLFGMILGNAMTGISLGLDTLTTAAVRERPAIEARIASRCGPILGRSQMTVTSTWRTMPPASARNTGAGCGMISAAGGL